ncbi:MAG TPA: ABC transporter permease [Gaiellaceae bacterium]|nr:ABC transporter permease [Gaiellaceae bacterium]
MVGEVVPAVGLRAEASKLAAFMRRDFLTAWSYRMVFVTDAANLIFEAFLFTFLGKLIKPSAMPTYDGAHAGYIEFVAVGIIFGTFIQLGLGRVGAAIRQEQLMGTLDSLLLTPTRMITIQLGSAVYDSIYIPIRTLLFLLFIVVAFGAHFHASGLLPTVAILIAFIPFVWGLGILSAAGQLTFRRGSGGINFAASLLVLGSGAFFPLTLMPHWFQTVAHANPLARAMTAMREALIGGAGWSTLGSDFLILIPSALFVFSLGVFAFQRALLRERRRGTLGVY